MNRTALLPAAYLADRLAGDPEWFPHPVRLIGLAIARGESALRRPGQTSSSERLSGTVLTLAVVGSAYSLTALILRLARRISPTHGHAAELLLAWTCLAARNLEQEANSVIQALNHHTNPDQHSSGCKCGSRWSEYVRFACHPQRESASVCHPQRESASVCHPQRESASVCHPQRESASVCHSRRESASASLSTDRESASLSTDRESASASLSTNRESASLSTDRESASASLSTNRESALDANDLPLARQRLARIVGRDTAALDASGISRALIETLAESASDGVIAPLFYMALGGVPLAMAYKAVNTLDSMIGHADPRYFYFGKAAARLDDAANFLPSRLTALAIIAATHLTPHTHPASALETWRSDARNHKSPNAGHPEAAVSGALRVALGGTNLYAGEPVHAPRIGELYPPPAPENATQAIRLISIASVLGLALAIAAAALLRPREHRR